MTKPEGTSRVRARNPLRFERPTTASCDAPSHTAGPSEAQVSRVGPLEFVIPLSFVISASSFSPSSFASIRVIRGPLIQ